MLRSIILVLIGLCLASISGVFWVHYNWEVKSLGLEVVKAFLQIGVVSVAATVVSLIVFEYQRERQNKDKSKELDRKTLEYREDLLKTVLREATARYSQCKKVRRLMRARAISEVNGELVVDFVRYDELMNIVNDSQLDIENLQRDVRNSAKAFTSAEKVAENLQSMEKYLKALIYEYEHAYRQASTCKSRPLKLLPKLEGYVKRGSGEDFYAFFVTPYHKVQELIRDDLLHPQLPDSKNTKQLG